MATVEKSGLIRVVITEDDVARLDTWLAKTYTDWSRSQWQEAIASGYVQLNDFQTRNSAQLSEGDEVTISQWPGQEPDAPLEKTVMPTILYEDDDVWVFDKPSGLIVHPASKKFSEPSIAGAVQALTTDTDTERPGIVHRLDRDTSGAIIVAKNPAAKEALQKAWKAHAVKKYYLAMVVGRMNLGSQRLAFNLGRSVGKSQKVVVDPLGRPSETIIHTLSQGGTTTLVGAEPVTGRTHQIRVHLSAIKHPVAGDPLYGGTFEQVSRLMLHAWKLTIPLPNGEVKTFVSPIPEEFARICEEYRCQLPTD